MTNLLPAGVTLSDLPTGTTITGAEILEAVQTTGGVGASIQVPISQIMTTALGGLPTAGATGQFLQKSAATNFSAIWANIASNVLASTGLAQAGSTTVSLSLASTVGLSVLAVGGTGSAVPTAIAGTGAQVFRINDGATAAAFGALNLGSAAAVTGVLPGANYSAVNLAATGAGGIQGFLPGTSIATTTIGTAQISTAGGTVGQVHAISSAGTVNWMGGMTLLNTLTASNASSLTDTTSLTGPYTNFLVVMANVVPTNVTALLQMQVATTGTSFITSGYVDLGGSSTFITLSNSTLHTSLTAGVRGSFIFDNAAQTTYVKQATGLTVALQSANAMTSFIVGGLWEGQSSAIVSMQFKFNNGTMAAGTFKVYGLA